MEPTDNPSIPKRSRKRRNLHEQLMEEKQESKMMIEIWKHFPKDLLEVVLTRILVVALYRLRVVCRRWSSLLTSPSFQKCWGDVAPTKQLWFFIKDKGIGPGSLYDPFTKRRLRSARVPLPTLARMVRVLDKDIVISTWRSKIVLVDNRGNYEVFTISNNITCKSPMITGRMPSHIEAPSEFSSSVVTIGTNLLFFGFEPHGIISYKVENGEWAQLIIPRPHRVQWPPVAH
ncbi:hypothetical protein V2J09_007041 [Rumex salicifolius]